MDKVWERRFIYAVYIGVILWIAAQLTLANAWELKVEDGRKVSSKECKACLMDFASCMDLVDKETEAEGKEDDVEPMRYVNMKLSCVNRAAACGEDNKCTTRVVRTEK